MEPGQNMPPGVTQVGQQPAAPAAVEPAAPPAAAAPLEEESSEEGWNWMEIFFGIIGVTLAFLGMNYFRKKVQEYPPEIKAVDDRVTDVEKQVEELKNPADQY